MHPWGGMIILSHAPVFSCGVRGGVGFMEYHSPTVVRLVDFFFFLFNLLFACNG